MKPVLDATAGNRMMWGNRKTPTNVVFMDKEIGLRIPPDIFAVWEKLPFRDNVFFNVIYDPPHMRHGKNSRYRDPKGATSHGTWWGIVENKKQLLKSMLLAQIEFARVSDRLHLKWNETHYDLFVVLKCFVDWVFVRKWEYKSQRRTGKSKTWWIAFIRKRERN